jgi:hypothetical protein
MISATSVKPVLRSTAGLLMLVLSAAANADYLNGDVIGEAYDLESGELLYQETHCVSADRLERKVIYQDVSDNLIALKRLDYRSGATTPSFEQHNLYSRESIEVALVNRDLTMTIRDSVSRKPVKSSSTRAETRAPVVIDAGFDTFIRDNWDSLVQGERLEFQFPVADRANLVDLRLRSRACSYAAETDQCFSLELANWFLRVLVAPVELGYDAGQRRLSRYRGLSNIGDENGQGQVVDIRYNYAEVPQRACDSIEQLLTENAVLLGPPGSRI